MEPLEVLHIVLREMKAYGSGWRADWSGFDGRTLQRQLKDLGNFAERALQSQEKIDFNAGTLFAEEQG